MTTQTIVTFVSSFDTGCLKFKFVDNIAASYWRGYNCLERRADLHKAQLMPLPLTVSCFSKIQIGVTFLVPAHPGIPGKRAVKRVCVCVCARSLQRLARTALGRVRRAVTSLDARSRGTVGVDRQGGIATGATTRRRARTVLATSVTHHRYTHTTIIQG